MTPQSIATQKTAPCAGHTGLLRAAPDNATLRAAALPSCLYILCVLLMSAAGLDAQALAPDDQYLAKT